MTKRKGYEMMEQNCKNCWWFCHSNGRCYADPRSAYDDDYSLRLIVRQPCTDWKFDCLEDWEREPETVCVTVR